LNKEEFRGTPVPLFSNICESEENMEGTYEGNSTVNYEFVGRSIIVLKEIEIVVI